MIPLLINRFNISLDFSLQLSKCLADSDLVVIGLTGIGTIRKIYVLDWFLPYWPNESFLYYIDRFDHIKANKSKLSSRDPHIASRTNMGREMITRPIWKCPCIKLFFKYFRHLEKRHPYWPGPIWASIWK